MCPVPWFLVWVPYLCACCPRNAPWYSGSGSQGAHMSGSCKTAVIRDSVLSWLPSPGRCTENRHGWKPVFLWKRSCSFSLKGTAQLGHSWGRVDVPSGNAVVVHAIFLLHSASLHLTDISWTWVEACLEPRFLWLPLKQGTPRDHLSLVVSRAYASNPTGLCIFAYFRSLRVWIPDSLNLSGCDPFLWDLTGLGTLSITAAAAAKSLQSCLTLCDPIDGSPPGSSIPGILQARTLEWAPISFSNAWKWGH